MGNAARAARTTVPTIERWIEEDDELADEIEDAIAVGEMAKVKTRSVVPVPVAVAALPLPPAVAGALELPAERRATEALGGEDDARTSWQKRWATHREEAAELGAASGGHLRWVERECVRGGLHPMDRQWMWHFEEFYRSGKMVDVGRFGLRAAKSDSCCRALVAEVLLMSRHLEPGIVGVCPVMAQNMREADDRFDTITAVLRACGVQDLTGSRGEDTNGGFQRSGGGSNARVIALHDADGHPVEFRIYPASVSGAAGFTGIAGFCDEVDLWGKEQAANPAKRVFEILFTRYTTQPGAKLHVMSASYNPDSEHAKMIAQGDTALQRVARLGEDGARIDTEARARLAVQINSTDPLLLTPAKPDSTDIPCWVSNPVAPIEACYARAKGDVRSMIFLYGGRVNPTSGRTIAVNVDEMLALAEANQRLVSSGEPRGEMQRFDGLPSWDPRSRSHGGGGGGDQSI